MRKYTTYYNCTSWENLGWNSYVDGAGRWWVRLRRMDLEFLSCQTFFWAPLSVIRFIGKDLWRTYNLDLLKMPGTILRNVIPNGGLMVIYHGTIRKKSPKKQMQVIKGLLPKILKIRTQIWLASPTNGTSGWSTHPPSCWNYFFHGWSTYPPHPPRNKGLIAGLT